MTEEQRKTAAACVAQAATRPMDPARKRQFAIVRTQAALKITKELAAELVDNAIAELHVDAGKVVIPADPPPPAPAAGSVDSAALALLESNAVLGDAAVRIESLENENASLKAEVAELSALLTAATAPPPTA